MKKKILIPTDFSKNAWNAIEYAAELYKREECDFYLLHAFTVDYIAADDSMLKQPGQRHYDLAFSKAEKEMAKTLQRLSIRNVYQDHTYFTIIDYNLPLKAITQAVEIKDIELIVMGMKGETDAKSILYGSNTLDVMEDVRNCPVLVIPCNKTYVEPKEIVFATSYKTHFKKREINHLFEVAKITNAKVSVLHINKAKHLSKKQLNNKKLLEEYLDGIDYSFHWLDNVEVNEGMRNFIESKQSDMAVFINKKHSLLEKIFTRPMVREVWGNSRVPVLVLHDLRN